MNKEEGLVGIPVECVFFMLQSVNCNCGFPVHCPNGAEVKKQNKNKTKQTTTKTQDIVLYLLVRESLSLVRPHTSGACPCLHLQGDRPH